MAKKVIIPKEFAHYLGEPLRDYGFEVVELEDQYADSLLQHKDADGMVLNATPLSNDTIDQMPNLKVIARFGVGYDNVDLNHCKERGIYVTNTPGGNEVAVA
ncbi:MAG: 3-phosphoglycerate dehydrogenase, partial [Apilactobacillus kunkeei]|nr:3-phosphoglycerate dehydrogenase [Apilactobacillus kunkeei]